MPFCHQCGAESPESARFCDQCGAALLPAPASTAQPATTTGPAVPGATTSAGPNTCPQCGMAVIPGEAFCDNCGAPLLTPALPVTSSPVAPTPPFSGAPPQPSYPAPQPVGLPPTPPSIPRPLQPAPLPASARTVLAPAQFIVKASGTPLPLPAATHALIGRADPVSNFYPDVDLTPHGALENGVGRRHAQVAVQNGRLFIEDLDSTNGTFINGQKLAPRTPHVLHNGDELRLGRLVVRVQL